MHFGPYNTLLFDHGVLEFLALKYFPKSGIIDTLGVLVRLTKFKSVFRLSKKFLWKFKIAYLAKQIDQLTDLLTD